MQGKLVTVFGGSGFIGRHVVLRLARAGARVRVAVRRPNEALFLKPMGAVGQIQLMQANVRHAPSVAAAVAGADAVVNLVGILHEAGPQKFSTVQSEGAENIARAAAAAGVKTLIHVSAIGADARSPSKYARSKATGEAAVRQAFPQAVILRPSIVFGPDDNFFNRFASMIKLVPAVPLIGGDTRFQPVYVADVADAIMAALTDPAAAGETFELGGPKTYTFRELLTYIMDQIEVRRPLLPLPFGFAKFVALFSQILPNPPLTVDQVKLLAVDNVVSGNAKTLADLKLTPTPVQAIVPQYLRRYHRLGEFSSPVG